MSAILDKVTPAITEIVEANGCYLVDMEYVKEGKSWFLRIYADKPGRIEIDDCAAISEQISEHLDSIKPDPFPEAYFLEVSSPGAERPLKTDQALREAVGEYVHLDYYAPQHGAKSHEGTLEAVTDDKVTLTVQIKTVKKQLEIERQAIAKARLAIKF